ncbi:MAG: hypothetical protein ACQERF_12760 [Actinomycetota bacterium]
MASGRDSTPGRTKWRTLGALLVLAGAAAFWMALTADWDLSEDWEAGVGTEWMPTSFEFIGLMGVVAAAGAAMALGFLFLIGKLPRPARHP